MYRIILNLFRDDCSLIKVTRNFIVFPGVFLTTNGIKHYIESTSFLIFYCIILFSRLVEIFSYAFNNAKFSLPHTVRIVLNVL